MEFEQFRRTTAWTVRLSARLSRYVDLILVNSWAGADYHCRLGYAPERLLVVPNGFDLELFRPDPEAYREVRRELGLSAEHLLVGMFARYDPQKDHGTFWPRRPRWPPLGPRSPSFWPAPALPGSIRQWRPG